MTTLSTARASELTLDLLEEAASAGGGDGARVIAILDEVASNPRDAVTLCHAIVTATAVVLRRVWEKAGAIEEGDLLGLERVPNGQPGPSDWRAAQMLTAAFNGDPGDSIGHAITAANEDRIEELMASLLLQWHVVIHLGTELQQ